MKILLIGPQGSGKSTQGKLLSEQLNIPFVSTGDIFRDIASKDTEEGKRIKQILDAGNLVDDETATQLVEERVKFSDCSNGFILDGYPRTVNQATSLDINFDKAYFLKMPREQVLERLLKRGRADDTEESINKRLDLYYAQTQPLVDYFRQKEILTEINAQSDIQTVQDEIKKSL
jgi:adenylate kinase